LRFDDLGEAVIQQPPNELSATPFVRHADGRQVPGALEQFPDDSFQVVRFGLDFTGDRPDHGAIPQKQDMNPFLG
jgi:hypothetical protein